MDAQIDPLHDNDRERLSGLLLFAHGLLSARSKTLLDMLSTGLGYFPESELVSLPGVQFDDARGAWLVLDRLTPTRAPQPRTHLQGWIDSSALQDPERGPGFLETRVIDVPIGQASDLVEGGLLPLADVHEYGRSDDQVRIVLRLGNLDTLRGELDEWQRESWSPWAESELLRRRSIRLYEQFYRLYSQSQGMNYAAPELVWGMGILKLKSHGVVVNMPLVEQLVEIELDEDSGTLSVCPRATRPVLQLKAMMDLDVQVGARAQRSLQLRLDMLLDNPDHPFNPHRPETWEPAVASAASVLAADARYLSRAELADGVEADAASDALQVIANWVLYARPISLGAREDDLLRLVQGVQDQPDSGSLPASLRGFVADLADKVSNIAPQKWPAVPMAQPAWRARKYFFPLPFNEQQARIVDRLAEETVVTVTGPPGTGKTHTIANILAHSMAVGQRVLVTARTAEAIAAVRDKLPEPLAGFVIASVASDREGARQLENAIQKLSDEVLSLDIDDLRENQTQLEAKLSTIDAEKERCRQALADIACVNLEPLEWEGKECTAMELTEQLNILQERHSWFADRPSKQAPSTLAAAVTELRDLLLQLGKDLQYIDLSLTPFRDIPDATVLLDLHKKELARLAEPVDDPRDHPVMVVNGPNAHGLAEKLVRRLDEGEQTLAGRPHYFRQAIARVVGDKLAGVEVSINPLLPIAVLWAELQHLHVGAVEVDPMAVHDREFVKAVELRCRGRRAIGTFQRFLGSSLARQLDAVRLAGAVPRGTDQWQQVRDTVQLMQLGSDIESRWEAVSALPVLPPFPTERLQAIRHVAQLAAKVEKAAGIVAGLAEPLKQLFPVGLDVDRLLSGLEFTALQRPLRANLAALRKPDELLMQLDTLGALGDLPVHAAVRQLRDKLGATNTEGKTLVRAINELYGEISSVDALEDTLAQTARLLDQLRDAGAPEWAKACRKPSADPVVALPSTWQEAWEWSRMSVVLQSILDKGNGEQWQERAQELERERAQLLNELIRTRTLLNLKPRITDKVQSALLAFTTAMRRLGSGTGQRASRWQRALKEAAQVASPAAPVWIMPEHKVAEQMPGDLGAFDLVILDEASQCDVTSIASLARGARCLIVGDAKQVSPSVVGIPVHRVDSLRAEFLAGLPGARHIDENTSIFDLACRMFPRSHLMLTEHFRCVEPIIRFSARYYGNQLVPLRVPRASERIDPPLIDIHISGATRSGDVNEAEVRAIVDEIAVIVNDDRFAGRTIGVISLLGTRQADRIQTRLMEDTRIGTEAITRHRILCGDARTLQGQERRIVFLSMVRVPDERGNVRASSTEDFNQRMNVAMSRACDRMYLVRSLALGHLKPGDVKAEVLRHFADPMGEGGSLAASDARDKCQSGFERAVCQRLLDAGYRTRAQVKVGSFSIDLVVEGAEDRRLAIELDGDYWHGPDQWERDTRCQASLERAGWVFWRVFGSQWAAHTTFFWDQLCTRLAQMGIEPIGAEASEGVFTECRELVYGQGQGWAIGIDPDAINVDSATYADTDTDTDNCNDDAASTQDDDGASPSVQRFYHADYRPVVRADCTAIIDSIGPIDHEHLCREVASLHGFGRTGARIRAVIDDALEGHRERSLCPDGRMTTLWPEGELPRDQIPFRGMYLRGEKRHWNEVPWPERVGLALLALDLCLGDRKRAMLSLIDASRLAKKLRKDFDKALKRADVSRV